MTDFLPERFTLTDSQSLLDIRGSWFDAVLLIEGRPLLYHWADCEGSVAQYLIYLMQPPAVLKSVSPITPFPTILYPNDSLRDFLAPILNALAPGEYLVNYAVASKSYEVVEFDEQWDRNADSRHFYPEPECFVATQSLSHLNESRVTDYMQELQTGKRPVILTISITDGVCDFVIDGHHKLAAYSRLRISPEFVSIRRLNPPQITPEEMVSYVPTHHPLRAACGDLKKKHH